MLKEICFEFECPNVSASLLVVSNSSELISDMNRVAQKPPVYDGRTLDDVQAVSDVEKLDKLDAFAVANEKLSQSASKYADSDTHQKFQQYYKSLQK